MGKTNADKIREMTDMRLTKFIAEECMDISERICKFCNQEPGKCSGKNSDCRKAAGKWLKSDKWNPAQDEREKLLEKSIDELKLSTRAYNALKRAGISTIKDLCSRTPDDMLRIRDMGRKTLDEIIQKMETHGLKFRTELEEHKC